MPRAAPSARFPAPPAARPSPGGGPALRALSVPCSSLLLLLRLVSRPCCFVAASGAACRLRGDRPPAPPRTLPPEPDERLFSDEGRSLVPAGRTGGQVAGQRRHVPLKPSGRCLRAAEHPPSSASRLWCRPTALPPHGTGTVCPVGAAWQLGPHTRLPPDVCTRHRAPRDGKRVSLSPSRQRGDPGADPQVSGPGGSGGGAGRRPHGGDPRGTASQGAFCSLVCPEPSSGVRTSFRGRLLGGVP